MLSSSFQMRCSHRSRCLSSGTSGNRTAMSPLCVMYRTQGNDGYCSYRRGYQQGFHLVSPEKRRLTFGSMIFRYLT